MASARTAAPGDLAGRGVHARGHVDRDHGLAGAVDPLDHPGDVLARRVLEPDAEQRVDDHVRLAEVAEPVDHVDLAAALAQHARADAAVAAVVPEPQTTATRPGIALERRARATAVPARSISSSSEPR